MSYENSTSPAKVIAHRHFHERGRGLPIRLGYMLRFPRFQVADAQGLSYSSDATLSRLLKLEPLQLAQARQQLIAGDLLAYQKPLYQVLSLPCTFTPASPPRAGQAMSVGDILRRVVEGGAA